MGNEKVVRNKEMRKKRAKGWTYSLIGYEYDISRQCAHKIINRPQKPHKPILGGLRQRLASIYSTYFRR